VSVIGGLLATVGLARLAENKHWCCVHGWAMIHGTGAVVFLLLALTAFHLASAVGAKAGYVASPWPPGWLAHTAYISAALGTLSGVGDFLTPVLGVAAYHLDDVLVIVGVIAAGVAIAWRLRGRRVRQFGLVIASLLVSCLSVAETIYVEWLMWRILRL
jgi:hypothetical protein